MTTLEWLVEQGKERKGFILEQICCMRKENEKMKLHPENYEFFERHIEANDKLIALFQEELENIEKRERQLEERREG